MKAFIISLSKIPSSIDYAQTMIPVLQNYGFDVKLFEGTYGVDAVDLIKIENRKIHPTAYDGAVIDDNYIRLVDRPGVKGCFYSHYRLWQHCVRINEPIFIFEDDVKFYRNYVPVNGWDDVLVLCMGFDWKISFPYLKYLESPNGEPVAVQYLGDCIPGTPGYAITPTGATKLINAYSCTFAPSDHCINKSVVNIKYHNYLMGRALTKKDGKPSLTKTTFWD